MKFLFILFFSILYCIGSANAQKAFSEKGKNSRLDTQRKTYIDSSMSSSSQMTISQDGGDNSITIKQNGYRNGDSFTTNYTEVYENGTNKVVIITDVNPDSVTENNAVIRQSRLHNRATVIQRGKGNSVSISQSPAKIE